MNNENENENPSAREHNPYKLTPEQVGKGWRLLKENESLEPGDEISIEWGPWRQILSGHELGIADSATYRRRTTPPTQEGTETPETDAAERFSAIDYQNNRDIHCVRTDFARSLERRLIAAQRENERLRGEVAGLKADKERLDWLEENNVRVVKPEFVQPYSAQISASGHMIRSAIDAARAATEEGK